MYYTTTEESKDSCTNGCRYAFITWKIGGKERVVCKESDPLSEAIRAKDRPEIDAAQPPVATVSGNSYCVCVFKHLIPVV